MRGGHGSELPTPVDVRRRRSHWHVGRVNGTASRSTVILMPYVELVEGIHYLLDGTWNATKSIREEFDGAPAPGSIAEREVATGEEGPGGPWGSEPALTAFSFVTMANFAAADHLGCLAVLIAPGGLGGIFGPLVLARACIEACARSWWLADPDLGVRERVERSSRVRLRSVDESIRLIKELLAGAPLQEKAGVSDGGHERLTKDLSEQLERRAEILDQAVRRGLPVHHDDEGAPSGINVAMPNNGKLVGELLEDSSSMGSAMYVLLSGITHTTPSALMQYFDRVDSDDAELAHLAPDFSNDSLLGTTVILLSAYFNAFSRLVRLFGWNEERWVDWVNEAKGKLIEIGERLENTGFATAPAPIAVGKAGRNSPCPCGSGKKFKYCHG